MRRLALSAAVLMLVFFSVDVARCVAQDSAQQGFHSSHAMFGHLCGIADLAPQSAIRLWRSAEGEWDVVAEGKHPGPGANAAARVWHESNWMVDLHDAPGHTMHTGELCFAAGGEILLLTDDYMDVEGCACVRYTAKSFDERGKVVHYMQRFVSTETGSEIAAPKGATDLPEVFDYPRVEQLPFYSLVSGQ